VHLVGSIIGIYYDARSHERQTLLWYHITAVPLPFVLSNLPSGEVSNELWMSVTLVAGGEVPLLHRNLLCNLCNLCMEMKASRTKPERHNDA
jgi:hypothetical protein